MLTNSTGADPTGDIQCLNCDTWLGLPGFHVTDVGQGGDGLLRQYRHHHLPATDVPSVRRDHLRPRTGVGHYL